jgi:DNA helicase-2/ATP-dependent DNA helicase PcrA
MVERRLKLEPEVQEILNLIDIKLNFLLSGGAGSGKTYSLVQVLTQIFEERPTAKIACMTYTNAAVKEIEDRVQHKNLNVSTIHDFIWDNIKHFQNELKKSIIYLANDEDSNIKIDENLPIPEDFYDKLEKGIQYKEYTKTKEGIISHDEVLIVANFMFANYPKLVNILIDKYDFIFIDEYQDTNKNIIEIFIEHLSRQTRKNILGFFGDSMQAIYDDGVGDIDEYVKSGVIVEVKKSQNRRNPLSIIKLANKLRTDRIIQEPSKDNNAPNMLKNGQVKEGKVLFLHSQSSDLTKVRNYLQKESNWNFDDTKQTKELNLTHNLIAGRAGFENLYNIYDKDQILKYRDKIKRYVKYEDNDIVTDFSEMTFGEVIDHFGNERSTRPTSGMQNFIDNNIDLFNIAKAYNYSEFSKIYVNKDQLLDDKKQDPDAENSKGRKRDNLINHLMKIQENIFLYKNGMYNDFLRKTDFLGKIKTIEDKKILKKNIDSLINVGNQTIEEIIGKADQHGICIIDDKLKEFIRKQKYVYDRVKDVKFSEFQKLFDYLEGYTPFSTQHKTKGTQFDNVLVILDNGNWRNYNYENLFTKQGTESVLIRTQKIFYVCCTRAKEQLAIFFHNPSSAVLSIATEWFGQENVIEI